MAMFRSVFTFTNYKLFIRILQQPFIPTRNAVKSAARRRLPTKPVINPFVNKRTNFIKELCVALVKYDRIQTTLHKALQLKTYGELVSVESKCTAWLWLYSLCDEKSCHVFKEFRSAGVGCPRLKSFGLGGN